LDNEDFTVKFEHVIAPNIVLKIIEDKVLVSGTVKIAIDTMLKEFTRGLGLKSIFDHLVEKYADQDGYHLTIKNIANADIFVKNNKLHVSAKYMMSKEWWAKPVAILVLGKLLNDFAYKVENSGIEPGFRDEIKKAMQQLRKSNYAILDLNKLFEEQKYYTKSFKVDIYNFNFEKIDTYSENGVFVIKILGYSDMKKTSK